MFELNTSFLLMVSIASFLFVLFIFAAVISAFMRKTVSSCMEVLMSMVKDPMFLTAFFGGLYSVMNKDFQAMFIVFLAYVGYKVVATEFIVLKNGDYRYYWFGEGSEWNKWASAIISTKTFLAILGVVIIWYAGLTGAFDAKLVSERILEMVGAWGLANGIPAITMLRGKDFSFLNPVPKPALSIEQSAAQVIRTDGDSSPGPASQSWETQQPEPKKPIPQTLPVPDTKVPFTGEDLKVISEGSMLPALVDAITEWFTRVVTVKAAIPDIPKVDKDLLLYQIPKAEEQRAVAAEERVSEQAYSTVFPMADLEAAYKKRGNCSLDTWRRVNYLFDAARDRWTWYNFLLWKYYDSQV